MNKRLMELGRTPFGREMAFLSPLFGRRGRITARGAFVPPWSQPPRHADVERDILDPVSQALAIEREFGIDEMLGGRPIG